MENKALLTVHSTASGLVPYNFPSMDQSRASHVDTPSWFTILKDRLLIPSNPSPRVIFEENSLAISWDAAHLRKGIMELDYYLYSIEDETWALLSTWLDEKLFSALDDVEYFWQTAVKKSSFVELGQAQLLYKLHAAFEADPFENGMDHPAEQIIKRALQFSENQQIFNWFEDFSLDIERPSFAASVLRCLGRQTNLGTYPWRAELIRRGLTVDNVEIRDAAVQATESWGDQDLVSILKSHHETEPWLREYILDVINDLGG